MSENIFRTLVKLRPVRTPQMASKVDFTACFYHSMTDAAFELLTSLTTKRAAIVAFMKPGAAAMSAADQLVLVDTYLVDVWNLVNSLNGQPPVKLDRQLQFDWICYLYTSKKEMNATSTGISFELMMTMHLKACLHHHIAKLMIDSDFRNVAEASKHLCIATGVMNCLEVSLVGTVPEMLNKPSEIKVEYCAFLRKYYMSCAQQMFAAKAIQSGNTLSAKVSLAVSDMLTDMMATIPPTGLEGLFDHLGFLRCFFAGIGYKLRAEALAAKNETGQAIACTIFAASVLFEQQSKPYNPLHPGLPKLKHIEEPFASGVRDLLAEIKTVRDSATKDNNLIYFHVAPNSVSELAEPFLGTTSEYLNGIFFLLILCDV